MEVSAVKLKQDISIGKNLKKLRNGQHLTQEAVAQKLQLFGCQTTRDIYAQMEIGKYNIRISELVVLKEIYRCDFNDFFSDLPTPEIIMQTNSMVITHEKGNDILKV